jgi:acetyl-CoA carboxylase biotin carboxyl carrier protein
VNLKEVKDLIQEILQSDISEFELEHTGTRVKLRRGFGTRDTAVSVSSQPPLSTQAGSNNAGPVSEAVSHTAQKVETPPEEVELHYISSPIVGTFYRSPTPGTEPYVKTGELVEEGTVLCVVEAMKLMNEIQSDVAGEVVNIYVENGHPVEFGQKLFGIRPRK